MGRNSVSAKAGLGELSKEKARLFELLRERNSRARVKIEPLPRVDNHGEVLLPASLAQERLWFINQLEGGGAAYNISTAVKMIGPLDQEALQAAFELLARRHEVLRTSFVNKDGNLKQRIAPHASIAVRVVDLEGRAWTDQEIEQKREESCATLQPFDLDRGPLIRAVLIRKAPRESTLLVTMHHIVSDGWSIGLLLSELSDLYRARLKQSSTSLEPPSVQYADYAQWQRLQLQSEALGQGLRYWRGCLDAAPPELALPLDRPRPIRQGFRGQSVQVTLDARLSSELRELAKRHGVTLFMVLHAAWVILLARLSCQDDIVVGTPVANRPRPELEEIIGLFVNTLVLRSKVDLFTSLREFLQEVKKATLAAYDHQHIPFEKIVEELRPERTLNRHPIFQVMIALQSAPLATFEAPGLDATLSEPPSQTSKFDLLLSLQEHAGWITGSVNYDTDLFDERTVERWVASFTVLLTHMSRVDSSSAIGRLQILSDHERRQLTQRFNSTKMSYPAGKFIHELFEEQVERAPHEVAVVCSDEYLTYRQLNLRANQLARYLRRHAIGPDSFVGLFVERGVDMVVGMLGILKAGAAYVPLDPNYPQQRLEYILGDTALRVLLTQSRLQGRLAGSCETIALDTQWDDIAKEPNGNLTEVTAKDSALAYVIYTSGSTGAPKGVVIEHHSAVNLIYWAQAALPGELFEQTLFSTSLNFDLSVYECFVPLSVGGSIHVVENALALLSKAARVTAINTVPSAIKAILDASAVPKSVRAVNLAGEPLKAEVVDRLFELGSVERVNNLYGPSETTTYSTWISMTPEKGFIASIGHPIANTQIYILDRNRQVVPIGVVGEIYIGGSGVARGYLNRPGLTAERFVCDPYGVDSGMRMYKTGDLGRWRYDGTIEYLGRNDHQVKIRGFRIELGEIEARLTMHENVREAVVLAREDAPEEVHLVAYVTARDGRTLIIDDLRAHISAVLPEYMMPTAFVVLDRLPLTNNGKLNRAVLPAPGAAAYANERYEAPQGELEETLARIWASLLRVERIGRTDNFFRLGGHSLLIVQMLDRLRKLGLTADVRRVFESPTLSSLAAALSKETAKVFKVPANRIPSGCARITPDMLPLIELTAAELDGIVEQIPGGAANIEDIYPLAPLQQGLLFHHLLNEETSDVYVIGTVLSLSSRQRLEELIQALQRVVERYDVLRTSLHWEQLPRAVQVVHRRATLPVTEITLDPALQATDRIAELLKPERQHLDLKRAPLMHLQVTEGEGGQWLALLQLHHIVIDGQSLRKVIADVVAHIEDHAQQLPVPVPYRNHVAYAMDHAHEHDAEAFFRERLAHVAAPTAPFGLVNVHGDGTDIEEAERDIDAALALRLRAQARRCGVSSATLFHAAWGLVVASTTGLREVVFGSVLLGRLQGGAGAHFSLGMYINTLPIRLQLHGVTVEQLVEHTQNELVSLLAHEQASLAVAQRCSGIVGAEPLFSSLLNYRHTGRKSGSEWASAAGIDVLATLARTNYPVTISVDDFDDQFRITAQTDRRVQAGRVVDHVETALHTLIDALERMPHALALALPVLPEGEQRRVVQLFNRTHAPLPVVRLVHELFEEQARQTPQETAIVHGALSMTYQQLNSRSDELARALRRLGLAPGEQAAICARRGVDLVVGLLAILKVGAAYIPLDPNYPNERLRYMIEDARPKLILMQKALSAMLPASDILRVDIEQGFTPGLDGAGGDGANDEVLLSGESLVYVIYTSGSTGRPKGIAMGHGSMVNLIEWHRRTLGLSRGQRVLQFAALSFDVAFQEIFSTLCLGGTLVMVEEEVRKDPRTLLELLSSQSVDRLFVPPMMLQSIAEYFSIAKTPALHLKDVITAGEQLRVSPEIVGLFAWLKGCRLHNHYGPTETHVVTALTLQGNAAQWPALPGIGYPIANTQIYILDGFRRPVPVGVTGEVFIAGANVATGYLKRPALTAERFIPDPYSTDPRAVMYRTGDLGRWVEDGSIEYFGRNDDQVKLRGHRIELSEIEHHITRCTAVREAAVVAFEPVAGEKRLAAYVTLRAGKNVDAETLRSHLKNELPEYMVPSAIVFIDTLPLTPSGKLDRRALPVPGPGSYKKESYEAPQGEVEEQLAKLWQELLNVSRVGRRDDFFEAGGHSLLVLKLLFRISRYSGANLRVTDVYQSPTIQGLARRITGHAVEEQFVDLSKEAVLSRDVVARPAVLRSPPEEILITGATGFVGRFLLAQLLEATTARIFCLVREKTEAAALTRVRATLKKWNLWRDEFESRLVGVAGDLRQARLGLDPVRYQSLSASIDCIYHCATSMNHLETYAMAKAANVSANEHLLRLATSGRRKVVNYISTTGVFTAVDGDPDRVVTEDTPIEAERHSNSRGYVASKWVGEKMFMIAGERGVPCNIFRLGLIWADTEQGRYDELQREYRMFKSCLLSGVGIKDYQYWMAPTPVDYAVRAIVALSERNPEARRIFHISSPQQGLEDVFTRCNEVVGTSLELLSPYEWTCRIKRLHAEGHSTPIVPLIESTFSLDEEAFNAYQRDIRSWIVKVDCSRTIGELEAAGVTAPVLDDALLKRFVESIVHGDIGLAPAQKAS